MPVIGIERKCLAVIFTHELDSPGYILSLAMDFQQQILFLIAK